jgi:hypothetical protein
MTIKKIVLLLGLLIQIGFSNISVAQNDASQADVSERMVGLFLLPRELLDNGFEDVSSNWQRSHTPMAIEMLSLSGTEMGYRFVELLKQKTGQDIGLDTNQWFVWWWQQEPVVDDNYAKFKSRLYGLIDEKFKVYFSSERDSRIRLDEVRWGGVKQDGIPPLRQPKMITASAADYLEDDNVIFGIKINGDARAYPKRILAWHEMFIDEIGGIEFAGVYCTLCGAVILYKTEYEGVRHRLGTSGFLYRSNKLMYDRDTQSLWNTTWGEPVIGPLTANGIQLERSYLVTTTWGEWKRRHPDTTVLSLQTGYRRDYGEGVAYNSYYSTDELMFAISTRDNRLKNKDEVLALVFPKHSSKSMAISADYLGKTPIYSNSMGKLTFVVLTDRTGANRVYETRGVSFVDYDRESAVTDNDDNIWNLSEDKLSLDGAELARLPAHRAFWFGWHAAYPDTLLVK